jgi:hypothetical protein
VKLFKRIVIVAVAVVAALIVYRLEARAQRYSLYTWSELVPPEAERDAFAARTPCPDPAAARWGCRDYVVVYSAPVCEGTPPLGPVDLKWLPLRDAAIRATLAREYCACLRLRASADLPFTCTHRHG